MNAAFDVILPVFLVIAGGWLAAKRGLMTDDMVDSLMRFAQGVAVPVLLAQSIGKLDLGANYDAGLFLSFYIGAFACFGLGILGARLLGRPATDAVAIGFAAMFSNSLLLGVPITERAYGTEALAGNFAIISIHSPLLMPWASSPWNWCAATAAASRSGRSYGRCCAPSPRSRWSSASPSASPST